MRYGKKERKNGDLEMREMTVILRWRGDRGEVWAHGRKKRIVRVLNTI